MALQTYREKRDFNRTPEPRGTKVRPHKERMFVVQKHAARRLHYDFRLELDGVLKSWAVPKGPSLNPADKRLAVEVEDHPLAYGDFEGTIPAGQYGGGNVIVWDTGTWHIEGDAEKAYRKGRLTFELEGKKLHGRWSLVRSRMDGSKQNWLLIKGRDAFADEDADIVADEPESVLSGVTVEHIGKASPRVWHSKRQNEKKSLAKRSGQKKTLPSFKPPLLPELVDESPTGKEWLYEPKYDGYRTLVYKDGGDVRCMTRQGLDWSERYEAIVEAVRALPQDTLVLDGEVVALDADGHSNFALLQEALKDGSNHLIFMGFDVLFAEGEDLRGETLEARKRRLLEIFEGLPEDGVLRIVPKVAGNKDILEQACKLGLEGIVSKKRGSVYVHGRSGVWVKSKCRMSETFTIVGYTSSGSRDLRALLLADKEGKDLRYVGKTGTGFNQKNTAALLGKLREMTVEKAAVAVPKAATRGNNVKWVKPGLLAEVEYRTRTAGGNLRQAAFKGLRPDKADNPKLAKAMTAGKPDTMRKAAKRPAGKGKLAISEEDLAKVVITHPERHLFGDEGVTKLDVAVYYAQVAEAMLPHILGRPLSLIRCTSDNPESCFYQRHAMPGILTGMDTVEVKTLKHTHPAYMYFTEPKEILELGQAGVVEVHPWNCHVETLEHPDVVILDLDPDETLPWKTVVVAAQMVKEWLEERGFTPLVKTTGGKGIHVVLPLEPVFGWDEVKGFAKGVSESFAKEDSKHFSAQPGKAKRKGKIFIDYLRNGRTATAVAPYSLRARPGGTVSLPLSWQELAKVKTPKDYTFETVPKIVKARKDPWAGYAKAAKPNTKALRALLKKRS